MDGFSNEFVETGEARIFLRRKGSGPPLLLLHGFPQTHLMWRGSAPLLAEEFTTVCADLRGYGASSCPHSDPDHAPYGKRALARDMVAVMERLGFRRFHVAGHDRGGRVAYRMALDHPDRIGKLAVLDILPTAEAWDRADARFALGFWPWTLLAQPAPLPERLGHRRRMRSSTAPSPAGARRRRPSRPRCAKPISRRSALPGTSMRSARSTGPRQGWIASMIARIAAAVGASPARCSPCGARKARWRAGTKPMAGRSRSGANGPTWSKVAASPAGISSPRNIRWPRRKRCADSSWTWPDLWMRPRARQTSASPSGIAEA